MVAAGNRVVTVLGGSGFLGRRIVRYLRQNGFYDVSINPDDPQVQLINADVHDERSVADALADAYGAVNAVSLYIEHGEETFHSVHVEAAKQVADQARRAGVKRLVHVSGIGADPRSHSLYIRKRGEGELAVREAFADAIVVRPAVMFGPDDAFLTTILKLIKRLPIYPMFGSGQMRLQPIYVDDVGQAIAKMLEPEQTDPILFEFGGPRVYSYQEVLRIVANAAGAKCILVPLPFAAWQALAWIAEALPSPPITRNQVELMQFDSTSSPGVPGLAELGISGHSLEEILPEILRGAGGSAIPRGCCSRTAGNHQSR